MEVNTLNALSDSTLTQFYAIIRLGKELAFPRVPRMHKGVIIEVVGGPRGELPSPLVIESYRQSFRCCNILVLNGVSVSDVDAILDPIVEEMGSLMMGVRYIKFEDNLEIYQAAKRASLILVSSPKFFYKLMKMQISKNCIKSLHSNNELATKFFNPIAKNDNIFSN